MAVVERRMNDHFNFNRVHKLQTNCTLSYGPRRKPYVTSLTKILFENFSAELHRPSNRSSCKRPENN